MVKTMILIRGLAFGWCPQQLINHHLQSRESMAVVSATSSLRWMYLSSEALRLHKSYTDELLQLRAKKPIVNPESGRIFGSGNLTQKVSVPVPLY